MKCNFSSPDHDKQYIIGKLSISQVRMCNFTRIELKTKKLRHSIIPAQMLSDQPGLGQHPKGVNYHFSSPQLDKLYVVFKLSISEAEIRSFSMIGQKIKK